MYRVTVCYGQPTDPAAFDSHYEQVHVPLVRQVPGLTGAVGFEALRSPWALATELS